MSGVPWAVREPSRPRPHTINPLTRRLLWVRSGGLDEVTGEQLRADRFDVHHRRKKSQGIDDSPANLLVVSRLTHNRLGQHERWARDHGYVLSFGEQPASTAILLHGRRYVLLHPNGSYIDAERGPEGDAA